MHRRTPRNHYVSMRPTGLRVSRRNASFGTRRHSSLSGWILFLLLSCFLFVAIYTAFDNGRVVVRALQIPIPGLSERLEGFTILHISDLNGARIGPAQQALAKVLKGRTYHAVCITGDMVGNAGDPYPFYELLSVLTPGTPVFFIAGDADPAPVLTENHGRANVLADYIAGAGDRGATYVDAPIALTYAGQTLWFSPESQMGWDIDSVEQAYAAQYARDLSRGSDASMQAALRSDLYQIDVATRVRSARAQMKEDDLHIVLSHQPLQPASVHLLQGWAASGENTYLRTIDLVLAGHYVGGQWRLPLLGALHIADPSTPRGGWFPDPSRVMGLVSIGSLTQYVSAGMGVAPTSPFPPFRLFNSPEVSLLRLTDAL